MEVASFVFMFLLMFLNGVSSNLDQDKQECGDLISGLTQCLSFVNGQDLAPTQTCCGKFREVINKYKGKKCLCVLVKDKDDPALGFKVNATLALSLPSICRAPANASECPGLLNLASGSAEAQVFEQFAPSQEGNGTIVEGIPVSPGNAMRGKGLLTWWFMLSFFTITM